MVTLILGLDLMFWAAVALTIAIFFWIWQHISRDHKMGRNGPCHRPCKPENRLFLERVSQSSINSDYSVRGC